MAASAVACQHVDDDGQPATDADGLCPPAVIEFVADLGTRANSTLVDGTTFHYGTQLGVFAYYTGQTAFGDGTGHAPNFMYDQLVAKGVSAWSYNPLKYWPNQQDDKVTFCAYYPYGGTGIGLTSNTTTGLPTFTFEVQEQSKDQVDFMLSEVQTDEMHVTSERTTSVTYQVELPFRHALSKVVLRVEDEETHSPLSFTATLSGWYDQGTCRPTTSAPVNWSGCTVGGTVFTTEEAHNANERVMLMIPGNLRGSEDPLLQFHYIYRGVPFESEIFHLNATGESTPLDDTDDLTEWEAGKTYIYTYHVEHTGNSLTISVNPWYQAGMVFEN